MLHPNFSPFPKLETERLVLRQLTIADEKEIFILRSDERVNEFIDRPRAKTLEDARNFIHMIQNEIANNNGIQWAITLKPDPALIGSVVYWNISKEENKTEIGYELLPAYHGKGIMQEALFKIIEFGFETMKLQTITAYVVENNKASIKLLERLHFKTAVKTKAEQAQHETIKPVLYILNQQNRSS